MKLLMLGGYAKSLIGFRGSLIKALIEKGVDVVCSAAEDDQKVKDALLQMGARFRPINLSRTGANPFSDFSYYKNLRKLIREEKPDVVFSYTHKPVIFGSLAAKHEGVYRVCSMITGLGYAFTEVKGVKQKSIQWILRALYKRALKGNDVVFFQNDDDKCEFEKMGLLPGGLDVQRVNGSGVDLAYFKEEPVKNAPLRFLMIARLLRDKGVYEYIQAAREVQKKYPNVQFDLVGPVDSNPKSIKMEEVEGWVSEGGVSYLGAVDDVRPHIKECSVYVLPSYREGCPRSVLEAMAMGRPVIVTDAPGCRETVKEGFNGVMVRVKDSVDLSRAIFKFCDAPEMVYEMGRNSRLYAEEKFDVCKVNEKILSGIIL